MRNLTLVSILLALVIGAVVWQKLLVTTAPDPLPLTADYERLLSGEDEDEEYPGECDAEVGQPSECESAMESSEEQGEMAEQRNGAHDTMMKSFDQKYDKYKDQVNGR